MFLVDVFFFLACKILTDWLDHLETGMKENPRVSHVFFCMDGAERTFKTHPCRYLKIATRRIPQVNHQFFLLPKTSIFRETRGQYTTQYFLLYICHSQFNLYNFCIVF